MDLQAAVVRAASSLGLLGEDGTLIELDSLSLIDFVEALERESGRSIPTATMHKDHFSSIETVVELLGTLH